MSSWDRSMLAMSGAELEAQETLLALRRALESGQLQPATCAALETALEALERELGTPT